MKKILCITISLLFISELEAQKNRNGVIYDKHPALELVKEFNTAFVSGDSEKIKGLVTEDVKLWNSMSTDKNQEASGLQTIIGWSNYWSSRLKEFSIEPKGQAYPDAFKFKGDQLWVYTYEILKGVDKENGFMIETPLDRSFLLNKEGTKIAWILESFNTAHIEKYWNSFKKRSNGKIWRDHPYIGSVRRLMNNFGLGEVDLAYAEYNPNARIYDINMPIGEYHTLEQRREWEKGVFANFDLVSVDESGYPDLLEYNGDGMDILSWWIMTFKDKRSKKNLKVYLHRSDTLNDEGKITRSVVYYNGQLLK
tara:strand:+ start:6031 stop:6957 length:927 start_codon:yes stop_codon:yes gene_type:complete